MEENKKKTFKEKILSFKQKAENDLEQERLAKKDRIKFHKKLWFSITKPTKYQKMSKEGPKAAANYLIVITAFFSIFLSIISSYDMDKNVKDGTAFIKENLPEIIYSEGTLKSDSDKKIVLKHKLIKELIGGNVIIDTNVEDEEIINQYIEEIGNSQKTIILLKNKLVTVNWNFKGEKQQLNYAFLLKQYAIQTSTKEYTEITKQDIINYIEKNTSTFTSYIIQYFVSYIIIYFGNFMIYIGVVSITGYLANKFLRLKFRLREIFSMSVYAFTLPIIIYILYTISYYFIRIKIPYFVEGFMILAYIYLIIALLKFKSASKTGEGEK